LKKKSNFEKKDKKMEKLVKKKEEGGKHYGLLL
jgi:hypothetical protein